MDMLSPDSSPRNESSSGSWEHLSNLFSACHSSSSEHAEDAGSPCQCPRPICQNEDHAFTDDGFATSDHSGELPTCQDNISSLLSLELRVHPEAASGPLPDTCSTQASVDEKAATSLDGVVSSQDEASHESTQQANSGEGFGKSRQSRIAAMLALARQLMSDDVNMRHLACEEIAWSTSDPDFISMSTETGLIASVLHVLQSEEGAAYAHVIFALASTSPSIRNTALRYETISELQHTGLVLCRLGALGTACRLLWSAPVAAVDLLDLLFQHAMDTDKNQIAQMTQEFMDRGAFLQAAAVLKGPLPTATLAAGSQLLLTLCSNDTAALQLLASSAPATLITMLESSSCRVVDNAVSLLTSIHSSNSKEGSTTVKAAIPAVLAALQLASLSSQGHKSVAAEASESLLSLLSLLTSEESSMNRTIASAIISAATAPPVSESSQNEQEVPFDVSIGASHSDFIYGLLATEVGMVTLLSQPASSHESCRFLLQIFEQLFYCTEPRRVHFTHLLANTLASLPAAQTSGFKKFLLNSSSNPVLRLQLMEIILLAQDSCTGLQAWLTAAEVVPTLAAQLRCSVSTRDSEELNLVSEIMSRLGECFCTASNGGLLTSPLLEIVAARWIPTHLRALGFSLLCDLQLFSHVGVFTCVQNGSLAGLVREMQTLRRQDADGSVESMATPIVAGSLEKLAGAAIDVSLVHPLLKLLADLLHLCYSSLALQRATNAVTLLLRQLSSSCTALLLETGLSLQRGITAAINYTDDKEVLLASLEASEQLFQQMQSTFASQVLKSLPARSLLQAWVSKLFQSREVVQILDGDDRLAVAAFAMQWLPQIQIMDGSLHRRCRDTLLDWIADSESVEDSLTGLRCLDALIKSAVSVVPPLLWWFGDKSATYESGYPVLLAGSFAHLRLVKLIACTSKPEVSQQAVFTASSLYQRLGEIGTSCSARLFNFKSTSSALPGIIACARGKEEDAVQAYELLSNLLKHSTMLSTSDCVRAGAVGAALATLQPLMWSQGLADSAQLAAIGLLDLLTGSPEFHIDMRIKHPAAVSNLASLGVSSQLPVSAVKQLANIVTALAEVLQNTAKALTVDGESIVGSRSNSDAAPHVRSCTRDISSKTKAKKEAKKKLQQLR